MHNEISFVLRVSRCRKGTES
uniref:Uncharacterized protein n=1 Tax=Anguilla anguilla TaxID=7936 RepID=A0A0E9UH70_ANGAN